MGPGTKRLRPARFTSRPEARGSGAEAVLVFRGSEVDSRGKEGPGVRSLGRELASKVEIECFRQRRSRAVGQLLSVGK